MSNRFAVVLESFQCKCCCCSCHYSWYLHNESLVLSEYVQADTRLTARSSVGCVELHIRRRLRRGVCVKGGEETREDEILEQAKALEILLPVCGTTSGNPIV